MTTALDVNPAVADFASAVRRSLSDLGADAVDELTDGLEADLADKLLDGAELGDPAAYAAELRAAAGLEAPRHPTVSDNVRENLADLRTRFAPLVAHPVVAEVLGFFVSLRPVWWLLRGYALFSMFNEVSPVPRNPAAWALLVGALLLSVQWGRGRWQPWRWSRGAVIVLSVLAVLMIPALASNTMSRLTFQDHFNPNDYIPSGLTFGGESIVNIFAYGEDGEPIDNVRLFDQDGDPLTTIDESYDQNYVEYWPANGESSLLVPSDRVGGASGWNVYPYQVVSHEDFNIYESSDVPAAAKRSAVPPPFDSVQQLLGYEAPVEEPAAEPAPAE